MRQISPAELANKSGSELSALYARVKEELSRTEPGSYEYEVLAASLDHIRRAYAARRTIGPKF